MVEHVVAAPVHHSSLHDRVVETAVSHDLLRGPLRFVVWRTAIRTRSQKTHQRDTAHPGTFRRLDDVPRSVDVDALEGLAANLAIDPRAVGDGVATFESGS